MERTLLNAMLTNNSTEGLYLTCEMLKNHEIDKLEDTWISMTSYIGKYITASTGDTWNNVNHEMLELLENEKINIVDALVLTAKLYLLYQKVCLNGGVHKQEDMRKMRESILDHFPEKGTLNYEGLKQFSRILPSPMDDTYLFYNRILAGLIRLLVHQEMQDDARKAIEYLSRKKLKLPTPNVWPAPTMKEGQKGDPMWILWGAMMLHYDSAHVATNWSLFTWKWRAVTKMDRIGLLWGIPYIIRTNVATIWTKEELKVIEKVRMLGPELWREVCAAHTQPVAPEPEPSIIDNFYPRRIEPGTYDIQPPPQHKPQVKSIKVGQMSNFEEANINLRGKTKTI